MHIAWRKAAVNGEDAPSPLRGGLGGGIQTDVRPLREKACLDWDPPPDLPRKGGGVAFYERARLPAPICITRRKGGGRIFASPLHPQWLRVLGGLPRC